MSLATSTSAKALQRSSADKAVYLFDGSLLVAYWNGSAGQVAQVTSPLSSPSVTNLFTTAEDGVSLWADNSSGTSSDIWVASSYDDASGTGPGIHVRHGTYNGSSFSWDTSTVVPGATQADTIQCSVAWNGTYLLVIWWDGASGTDRVAFNFTLDKTGQAGWLSAAYAPVLSESATWSTISQVVARHSPHLGATIVVYSGNSAMHYACLPDSGNYGPAAGATLSGSSTWAGTTSSSTAAGVLAAVKPSGTTPVAPVGSPSLVNATSGSVAGAWGTGQNRTAGNLLVAVVSATGTTSAATISTPSGWTQRLTIGGATKATIALYTKTAAGADAAPAFTSTISGTATMGVALLELANANTTSPVDASGTATASASGVTVTTSGSIASNGDFAVAGFARERAATSAAYTPATGWANLVNDGATSSTGHFAVDARCGPDVSRWGGRATYDSFTDSYGFGGPAMVVDEANGNIHCVKASPNAGGPTWTGIVYWLGAYNSGTNTVTWGTRVAVDSTSTTTGPPEVTVGIDVNGKVYAVWVTDQSADSMKYATLVSPYTSATAGGTISTGGSTPRYPHCPPLSKSGGSLDTALPVLFLDATSTPFPVNLDTSVTLPGGGASGTASLAASSGLTAGGTVAGSASLAAAGSLAAGGAVAGAASLAAAGTLAAAVTQGAGAALTAGSALAAPAVQRAGAPLAAVSSLAAPAAQETGANLAAASSVAAGAVQEAGVTLAAASALAAPAVQRAGAVLTAAAALSSPAVQEAGAALAAASTLTASAGGTTSGTASLAAASSLAAGAVQGSAAQLGAASSLTAGAAQEAGAALTAASGLSAPAVQEAGASLAAASSLTAAVAGAGGAALAAAASLSAPAVQRAGASLSGAGALAAGAGSVVPGSGSLAAASSLSAGASVSGAASLAALSALLAPARQGAGAALAALSAVSAPAAQRSGALLAAASALTATATQRGPFTVGILAAGTSSGVNATSTYAPTGETLTSSGVLAAATSP